MNLVFPDHGILKTATMEISRRVSDRELMELSEQNQGFQVEWFGKEKLLVVSPNGSNSGNVSGLLYAQLLRWARESRAGRAYPPDVGFRLSDGSVLSPDVAFVRRDALREVGETARAGFPTLCPDLVIEVKSPSDSVAYLRKKCRRWIASGARAAILVDADKRTAEVFQQGRKVRVESGDRLEVPGFEGLTLDLADAWDDDLGLA